MEFPLEIKEIIREYSKPLTRPDWRRLHKYTLDRLEDDINNAYDKTINNDSGYYYQDDNIVIIPSQYILYLRVLLHTRNGSKIISIHL